jgi:hypothetical protein
LVCERLVPALDTTQRWDRELSGDEQLTLAFARVLLQAPPWILIDDTLRSLDGDTLERFMDALTHELQAHRRDPYRRRPGPQPDVFAHAASRSRRRRRTPSAATTARRRPTDD